MKFTLTAPLLFCVLATAEHVHSSTAQSVTVQPPTGKCTRFEAQKETQTPEEKTELQEITGRIREAYERKREEVVKKMGVNGREKSEKKTSVTVTNETKDGQKDVEKKDEQKEERKEETEVASMNEKSENEEEVSGKQVAEFYGNLIRSLSTGGKDGNPLWPMMQQMTQGFANVEETPATPCAIKPSATCPPSAQQLPTPVGFDMRRLGNRRTPCSLRSGCSPCSPCGMTDKQRKLRANAIRQARERQALIQKVRGQPRRMPVFRVAEPSEPSKDTNTTVPAVVEKSGLATFKV